MRGFFTNTFQNIKPEGNLNRLRLRKVKQKDDCILKGKITMKTAFDMNKATVMEERMDLFEVLRNMLCCNYISDLRMEPYNQKARFLLCHMDLGKYAPGHVKDVSRYLGLAF